MLVQSVKNHTDKFFNEKSESIPIDGIVLTAYTDNKVPIIRDEINITLKITNTSEETR